MEASQQFKKGIKAVCQHGKGIKAIFSGGEIKHKNVTSLVHWLSKILGNSTVTELQFREILTPI